MRVGICGGTFDPVHYGHLLLAEQCREQCALDEVWFMPTSSPPHKEVNGISTGKQRAEMLELATAGIPEFRVSRMELERTGTTYTVETLQQLRDESADRELFFLIGADSLGDLPTWRNPSRILELATLVAVNRGRGQWLGDGPEKVLAEIEPVRRELGAEAAASIRYVNMPAVDLSATEIRRRIREDRSVRFMIPRAVEMYIRENQLYCSEENRSPA